MAAPRCAASARPVVGAGLKNTGARLCARVLREGKKVCSTAPQSTKHGSCQRPSMPAEVVMRQTEWHLGDEDRLGVGGRGRKGRHQRAGQGVPGQTAADKRVRRVRFHCTPKPVGSKTENKARQGLAWASRRPPFCATSCKNGCQGCRGHIGA